MKLLAKVVGGALMFLLGCTLLTALSLFVLGAFLCTYPLHRLSPRDARLRAGMDIALAVAGLVSVVKKNGLDNDGDLLFTSEREQATE